MLKAVVAAAVVTGIYDVILQVLIKNKCDVFFNKSTWFISLEPYFASKTPLEAALLAAFIGGVAQWIILSLRPSTTLSLLSTTFIVSAALGIPIKYTGLFPELSRTYYDKLGNNALVTDGVSGVIVQLTLLLLNLVQVIG